MGFTKPRRTDWPAAVVEIVRVVTLAVGATLLAVTGKIPAELALLALTGSGALGALGLGRRLQGAPKSPNAGEKPH